MDSNIGVPFPIVAGQDYDTKVEPYDFFRVESVTPATANLKFIVSNQQKNGTPFPMGVRQRFESRTIYTKLVIQTDVNCTVVLSFAEGDKVIDESSQSPAPSIPGLTVVEGPNPADAPVGSEGALGNPLMDGMAKDNGDGTWTPTYLQTDDLKSLKVRAPKDSQVGFLVNTGDPALDVSLFGMARVTAFNVGDQPVQVTDSLGNPMVLWEYDGTAHNGTIAIADASKVFYVPLAGAISMLLASAGQTVNWAFRVTLSTRIFSLK